MVDASLPHQLRFCKDVVSKTQREGAFMSFVRWIFGGTFVAMCVVTALTFLSPASARAVESCKWDYVCCGRLCPGGVDVCMGAGQYCCCK